MSTDPYPIDELVPADDDALEPDAELAALEDTLEADGDDPDDLVVATEEPPPLGRAWQFDFSIPGFVRGQGGGSPLETRDLGTLHGWIEKCLRTERDSHAIHPPGYGLRGITAGLGQPHESPELADLEERIAEALTFHPRIVAIEGFAQDFDPDDEYLAVAFDVVLDDETRLPFTATL